MNKQISIIGYPTDEGVRRNNGRVGAAAGPAQLRAHFTKLHSHVDDQMIVVNDLGDVVVKDGDIETAQQTFRGIVANSHGYCNAYTLGLGGGHDIAYAHIPGLMDAYPKDGIGIINLDAHFDLRPYKKSGSTSGTPFLQVLDEAHHTKRNVGYLPIGIQPHLNAPFLFETAKKVKCEPILAEDMYSSRAWHKTLDEFMDSCRYLYVSLDLDVFQAASAPGVSALNALGLDVAMVHQTFMYIMKSGKVKAMDIAELNPTYDDANQSTARLGAAFMHSFIHSL